MENKLHELKILPNFFEEVVNEEKKFEIRKNDRDYQAGDLLLLQEWDYNYYTGNEVLVSVTSILYGGQFGLAEGYCIMSIGEVD